jgi:hypothetical protein
MNDSIRAFVHTSRAAQGLPPVVEDPIILDRVAALLDVAEAELARARAQEVTADEA